MAQPTAYTRQYDFEDFQSSNPTTPLPGDQVDVELNAVKTTTDEIRENLALIQRDDGALANAVVTPDALSLSTRALLATTNGEIKGAWATSTVYALGDIVEEDSVGYMCVVAHTAGTFATDLAADKWVALASGNASEVVYDNAMSGLTASNTQSAIDEIATDSVQSLMALTPEADTLPYFDGTGAAAGALAVFTAVARSLLAAATAAAMRTVLALGTSAVKDTGTSGDTVPLCNTANAFSAIQKWSKGADISAASPLVLGTDGNYFDVLGTTGITSIATTGTVGTVIKLHFDGIVTLTHHATDLVLPGGADMTTAVGDELEFVEYASGDWRCTGYVPVERGYLLYQEQRASGTTGPVYTADAWRTVELNTEVFDTGGHGAVASDQVTLDAGTYEFLGAVSARVNASSNATHRARLRNVTDGTTVAQGNQVGTLANAAVEARVSGRFTITASKVFELQIYATEDTTTPGTMSTGEVEVYASLELRKVS